MSRMATSVVCMGDDVVFFWGMVFACRKKGSKGTILVGLSCQREGDEGVEARGFLEV